MQSKLAQILEAPYPSNSHYRSMPYRPDEEASSSAFNAINDNIFGGILKQPPIRLKRLKKTWGWCQGEFEIRGNGHWPYTKEIVMYSMYPSVHLFVATLGHEMVHHWQWTINSVERMAQGKKPLMSHGPTFYQWRKAFAQQGLPLGKNY